MQTFFKAVHETLRIQGVTYVNGLSDSEIQDIEYRFGFSFPPDLKEFLQLALPISDKFPNWRGPELPLRDSLSWPLDGIIFDIDNNAIWLPEWGQKPNNIKQAHDVVRKLVSEAPVLIPIYAHRYIPDSPREIGNPVYSVYQTDIIYYGHDISSYLAAEIHIDNPNLNSPEPRYISFWGDLVS